jgi:hypothetical protein
MEIDESVIHALNGMFKVAIFSLYVAIPLIMLILLMYGYERYKKWKYKEDREAERIIVKRNEDIVKANDTINSLKALETELRLTISKLDDRKAEREKELGIKHEPEQAEDDKSTLKNFTIKELQAYCKDHKIKGYSRKSKDELLEMLGV